MCDTLSLCPREVIAKAHHTLLADTILHTSSMGHALHRSVQTQRFTTLEWYTMCTSDTRTAEHNGARSNHAHTTGPMDSASTNHRNGSKEPIHRIEVEPLEATTMLLQ
jgi:hypothetical protein